MKTLNYKKIIYCNILLDTYLSNFKSEDISVVRRWKCRKRKHNIDTNEIEDCKI